MLKQFGCSECKKTESKAGKRWTRKYIFQGGWHGHSLPLSSVKAGWQSGLQIVN